MRISLGREVQSAAIKPRLPVTELNEVDVGAHCGDLGVAV